MTEVGSGGVIVTGLAKYKRFEKDYKKLTAAQQKLVDDKLVDLMKSPMPSGLRFEKLKGYSNPDRYTIHIDGNYKASMEVDGSTATLRRVGTHDRIDRAP